MGDAAAAPGVGGRSGAVCPGTDRSAAADFGQGRWARLPPVRSRRERPVQLRWVAILRSSRLLVLAAFGAALAIMTFAATSVVAASSSVECGQLTAYTAPDPAGPTDGNVQLGLSAPWDVLATATISAAAESALPTLVNNAPTCLALDFDNSGKVSAIDFARLGDDHGIRRLRLGLRVLSVRKSVNRSGFRHQHISGPGRPVRHQLSGGHADSR